MADEFGQLVADIPGAVARGQQFRQQEALRPLQLQQAEQQLQFGQLKQQQVEQQIETEEQRAKSQNLFNAVARIRSLPDGQKLSAIQQNIQDIESRGGDATESRQAEVLATQGNFAELNEGLDNLFQAGVSTGFLKQTFPGGVKPTASGQDFETFKQLNARAAKTGDPIDLELAEKFGRQSGFDRETPQELADIEVGKESKKALVKQAATASKEAFDSLKGVRRTIANIDDAIRSLDKGAETGPIISKLPSFRQAAIELDNIKGRMGLDVVGATTFGALSESELAFALNVALPDKLDPASLKDWLNRKKSAQTKLANELRKAASFLGTPGNTIADYIAQQEKEFPDVGKLSDDELFN